MQLLVSLPHDTHHILTKIRVYKAIVFYQVAGFLGVVTSLAIGGSFNQVHGQRQEIRPGLQKPGAITNCSLYQRMAKLTWAAYINHCGDAAGKDMRHQPSPGGFIHADFHSG